VIAPFGITGTFQPTPSGHLDLQPIENLGPSGEPFRLLWFGGVYPWFDMTNLFDAVGMINDSIPCELTIVGIKNPFNHHPWFKEVAQNLLSLSEQERFQKFIRVEDWVPYEDRIHYYKRADLAICINAIGIENSVSWRTRILDYLWASLPFATNGGDPISELLIDAELGLRVDATSTESLAVTLRAAIQKIQEKSSSSSSDNPKLTRLQMQMQWSAIGDTIATAVSNMRTH
jgi:glycosyltransferase involved in cell wall biosynthesis